MTREKIKIFGFYALAVLILLRVVIVPYQNTIKEKKALLREYEETYRMRAASFERFKGEETTRSIKKLGRKIFFCKHQRTARIFPLFRYSPK